MSRWAFGIVVLDDWKMARICSYFAYISGCIMKSLSIITLIGHNNEECSDYDIDNDRLICCSDIGSCSDCLKSLV